MIDTLKLELDEKYLCQKEVVSSDIESKEV
jgi:hypothetical protein